MRTRRGTSSSPTRAGGRHHPRHHSTAVEPRNHHHDKKQTQGRHRHHRYTSFNDPTIVTSSSKGHNFSGERHHPPEQEWMEHRSNRQEDILKFAIKRTEEGKERRRQEELASKHLKEEEESNAAAVLANQKAKSVSIDGVMRPGEPTGQRNILTEAVKVAQVTVGVTALVAKEAVSAITDPKHEFEKVKKITTKTIKKIDSAIDNPERAAQKIKKVGKYVSGKIIEEATEVTKGTLQLGKNTVDRVTGLVIGESDSDEDGKISSDGSDNNDKQQYRNSTGTSLLERVSIMLVEDQNQGNYRNDGDNEGKTQSPARKRPQMPTKLGSVMIRDRTGMSKASWDD